MEIGWYKKIIFKISLYEKTLENVEEWSKNVEKQRIIKKLSQNQER